MKTVLVPSFVRSEIDTALTTPLSNIKLVSYSEDQSPIIDAEGAVGLFRWIAGERFAELVDRFPTITWLHTASAGVDHVITPTIMTRESMVLSDSGPAFGPSIAEYVFAVMLSDARRLGEFADQQKNRVWQKLNQRELSGATIGIVGLGPIGIAIAQRAKAFGMTTVGVRRTDKPAEYIDELLTGPGSLNQLLERSDYTVIAAALTTESKHLIGEAELSCLKPDSLLINIARGGLIDEEALADALRLGTVRAAVLDVFSTEPLPPESEFWDLPNVTITPHNSFGGTPGLRRRQIDIFVENLRKFSAGEKLDNVVDIARGY